MTTMTAAEELKRLRRKAKREHLECAMMVQIRAAELPEPTREHRFHTTRKWRADFAWLDERVLLEVEGIGGKKSRHTTFTGYTGDVEKYNEAALCGWLVLRVTGQQIDNGQAIAWLTRALENENER